MECKYKKISLSKLKKLVKESITYSELMRKLGYTANRGSSFQNLRKYLECNKIDTSHFKGKAHGTSNNAQQSLEEIMVEDSKYSNMTRLKKRIIKAKLIKYKCSCCGLTK